MSEVIIRLEDLHDAVPKFRLAADDINRVQSTVHSVLSGLDGIVSNRSGLTSDVYEHMIIEMADALDRSIRDFEEALAAAVGNPDDPWWDTLPDDPTPDDDDSSTHWPDGTPKHHDDDDDDDDGDDEGEADPGSGATFPPTSSSTDTDNNEGNNSPGSGQQNGGQNQQGNQGQSDSGTGQNQPGTGNDENQDGGTAGGGIVGAVIGALGLNKKKKDGEEEEEEEAEEEYVSSINAPVKKELDEKKALLEQTETRMTTLESDRTDKAELLGRLQAAAAASSGRDPQLEDRIDKLKKELTEIDSELYYGNEDIPKLREDIDALQKRLDIFQFGPDADLDAVRALEGGETSQWIRDATHNEDNSVNCVNYVVNRMPIPPELPFNAHLWDEQVEKYGPKYGITVGETPLEGSVIVMEREHSYANDIYGHVMYVESVDENGVVWVTDNNYMDKPVRLDDLTGETSGPYIHYLYFPYQTKA